MDLDKRNISFQVDRLKKDISPSKPPLGLPNVRRNYTAWLRRKLFIIATLPFLAGGRENKKVGFDLWRKFRV